MADRSATAEGELRYEELLERLQGVVERLERGDLPLEESLKLYEDGVRLARLGGARLEAAEKRLEQIVATDTSVGTAPMVLDAAARAR